MSIGLISYQTFSQAARLKVFLDPITEQLLQEGGIEMDHGQIKRGVFLINDFTAEERAWMEQSGIHFEVLVDHVTSYYVERNALAADVRTTRADCFSQSTEAFETPENFSTGSMGGFFTYEEFLQNLDSMTAKFPALITARAAIDTFLTHEGREVYWLKISDNVATNEAEPEVLYTAIHHAREPQSLSQLIFYMWYLLENYGSDDEVTHLVDNTEMYFIPMINPDGYIQNQTTNPNGGGLWRKNKRDNGNGTFGVDLNRNYGYEWGYDNSGSEPNPLPGQAGNTYRGPSAFSEPETKAVKWFCEQHEFQFALNYHSSGNYLIYPWGYIPGPLTPDSNYFISIAQLLTEQNNYVYGTGFETVAYAVNGDSDDWMYGEQSTKNKIFSMTPEVGNSGDGFWPTQARIIPLSEENARPNLLLAHLAGDYVRMFDVNPSVISSIQGQLTVQYLRLGLLFTPNYEFSIEPVSSNLSITTNPITYSSMNSMQVYAESFAYELDPSIAAGDIFEYDIVANVGGFEWRERISKIYGQPTLALNAEAYDTTEFYSQSWSSTTEDFVSSPSSITDSPNDFYANASVSEIEYQRVIDMRQSVTGYLSFQAKWQIEAGWDYCQILASAVDEESWNPLCGLYTKEGTENQDQGQPVWDGNQNSWVMEEVDLSDYIGQRIKVKFRLVSDNFVNYDGFYFDDLEFVTLIDEASEVPLDTGYLAISEIQGTEHKWQVYPNPVHDQLHVRSNYRGTATLTLVDMRGIIGLQQSLRSFGVIDLSKLAAGAYIVKISTSEGGEYQQLLMVW